ncbi:peptidoglycan-binding domain-containing protein [Actinomadura roseirufa]|uniref:peptidoglycan-binding domain-containing protein n=1 Tax=Actinomadura roseirufa TaxID=2094049 RepID=UPI0010419BB6|nr:peptidoglycan-binding domain-containing protein [Actinomadura roseirufa]
MTNPKGQGATQTASPPWPGRYLRQPPVMQGDDVYKWQDRMHERGWKLQVDGYYGPKTEAVCVAFQEEKHLEVDGIVGPKTWAAAWTAPIT